MKTTDDFRALVQSEVGLTLTAESLPLGFDELPGWDSLNMLTLLTAIERETGRRVSMPDVLEATSLLDIYTLTVRTVDT